MVLSTWGMKLLEMVHCMMKSMDLTMGNALFSLILVTSLYTKSRYLFLWFRTERPRHVWRRLAI
jgi:hypothetical protein